MKIFVLTTSLLLSVLHAQTTSAIDIAERRQSVVDLKKHVEMREQRLLEIATDIRSLDDRNEKRIDAIVEMLRTLKDSESTKTRINALKGDVIAGLRKSITIYQTKRRDIFERLRTDKSASMQALTGDLEKFDTRTQKRVDQILELAKSMPAREDVDKYETDSQSYWNGWHYETSRISEEWKQNRRQGVATEKTLRELREALEKAIVTLESTSASTRGLLKDRNLSDSERAIQEQELGRITAMLDHRRAELVELALPATSSAASESSSATSADPKSTPTPAAKDSAEEMKHLLDDARKDITEDFWTVLRKYSEATKERDKILALKANLEAREKWLVEHDKPAN